MKNQQVIINTTVVIIIIVIASLVVGAAWYYEADRDESGNTIQQTANIATVVHGCMYNTNTCTEGYQCYHSVTGALNSGSNPGPIETIGGDIKCHKICTSDEDCEKGEICTILEMWTEDTLDTYHFCM